MNLESIQCEEIRDNIQKCDEAIRHFIRVVSRGLEHGNIYGPEKIYCEIIEKDGTAFENDGNTRCPGKDYTVIWALDITGGTLDSRDMFRIKGGYCENTLYFTYEQSERLRDHRADRSRFFSLYVAGMQTPETRNKQVKRIDYNNDNYRLLSIINPMNAALCHFEIKQNYALYKLIREIENNLTSEEAAVMMPNK